MPQYYTMKMREGETVSTIPMLYKDASLTYTGLDKHEGEQIGGWDSWIGTSKARKSNGGLRYGC